MKQDSILISVPAKFFNDVQKTLESAGYTTTNDEIKKVIEIPPLLQIDRCTETQDMF
jgi:hypothetical protein